ncbi:alpha/beta hydrolase [Shumkonia mesophila]|uniref:alpha/beta hydrolase n=1 Tax=Shumkonia mesophila TaxID=2838854 RepID=UPI002934FDF2|nr:alpha/beta hydrolase [Shumkonia mesophila]
MVLDPTFERHYNVRAAIPEHPAIFAAWKARSEAFRKRTGGIFDVAYGPSAAETLDLFPAGVRGAPVHLFIHGGYWQALDKADSSFIAEAFVEAGVTVAVVNYALCPAATIEAIVEQMRRALLWLWRHAAEHGGDAQRIQVSGHSAGGHLVGMLMATDWPGLDAKAPRRLIKSGVAISGLFDLGPLVQTTINDKVGMDAATAGRLSPLFLDPAAPESPLLLAVGGLESEGFHGQSDTMAAAWRAKGVAVERLTLPGRHHLSAVEALADPATDLFRRALALV